MAKALTDEHFLNLKTTESGSVPYGYIYISFYVDGAGATVQGVEIPPGGYTMPIVPGHIYPEITYNPNGNNMFIRAITTYEGH